MQLHLRRGFELDMLKDPDMPISSQGIWLVNELPGLILFSHAPRKWCVMPARTGVSPDHPFRQGEALLDASGLDRQEFQSRKEALQALEAVWLLSQSET